ncbi:MAG: hypothetical protein KA139_01500 [Rhodobacteraceae bacterium]|nr:hypothetical protein [Paracoccaceae bacterium]
MAHRGRQAGQKEPLCRKVNTLARGVRHASGGDYAWQRNSKAEKADASEGLTRASMGAAVRRGLDYTPLFRFLLSKVGQDWDAVHSEAVARLDRPDPIFWLVARRPDEQKPVVWIGESSRYSGLYIDEANRLQRVDPSLTLDALEPLCPCCTHTFNGQRLTRPYRAPG